MRIFAFLVLVVPLVYVLAGPSKPQPNIVSTDSELCTVAARKVLLRAYVIQNLVRPSIAREELDDRSVGVQLRQVIELMEANANAMEACLTDAIKRDTLRTLAWRVVTFLSNYNSASRIHFAEEKEQSAHAAEMASAKSQAKLWSKELNELYLKCLPKPAVSVVASYPKA